MKTEIRKITTTQQEKTREASSRFPSPSNMEICTDEPVAIILEKANTTIITGITRLMAARASSPMKRPTNRPSATE